MRTPGLNSCIRFNARRKVDLPHPLGPMIAVTRLLGIWIEMSCSAWWAEYQSEKLLMANATSPIAGSALADGENAGFRAATVVLAGETVAGVAEGGGEAGSAIAVIVILTSFQVEPNYPRPA